MHSVDKILDHLLVNHLFCAAQCDSLLHQSLVKFDSSCLNLFQVDTTHHNCLAFFSLWLCYDTELHLFQIHNCVLSVSDVLLNLTEGVEMLTNHWRVISEIFVVHNTLIEDRMILTNIQDYSHVQFLLNDVSLYFITVLCVTSLPLILLHLYHTIYL